ncbi:MAG: type II toxin-antitoxin system VapC family toxin [Spirochaetes bacterium]|nr:type II toxin-antitoxin system VapC family toxin [Spirochaetota bacterium]
MNVLIDASALMAVLINEPEKSHIINLTKNCNLLAPSILPYEIGNALTRLKKSRVLSDQEIIMAYNEFKKIPLRLLNVDVESALIIACKYLIYAYDASYLEIANRLNLPILTLDGLMKKIALDLKLKILE